MNIIQYRPRSTRTARYVHRCPSCGAIYRERVRWCDECQPREAMLPFILPVYGSAGVEQAMGAAA